MKHRPDPDYIVELHPLAGAVSLEMHRLQPRGMMFTVNGVDMVMVEALRAEPWPPPSPADYDHWETAEQAAEYLFEVSSVTIAPGEGVDIVVKESLGIVGNRKCAFFVRRAMFEALRNDIDALLRMPAEPYVPPGHRLHMLKGRPLGDFLTHTLPTAHLDDDDRRILCLE